MVIHDNAESVVDAIIARVGRKIVLALPPASPTRSTPARERLSATALRGALE
ncbi:MAG: hypothetical protein KF889_23035 [Alphaproteobacteria bacterium]|nr:hypothetical protein [Alphaproteobacteria bacterium]MCW5744434.1 hypothetical protein [Alphaproteobacteria bacterium]